MASLGFAEKGERNGTVFYDPFYWSPPRNSSGALNAKITGGARNNNRCNQMDDFSVYSSVHISWPLRSPFSPRENNSVSVATENEAHHKAAAPCGV
uniref:Uncharacterized protein n=1 Tax=Picea sitchensis TaxID=3332 RepID=A9NXR2_PICSI|nr:unknown [Picea sitchensis]